MARLWLSAIILAAVAGCATTSYTPTVGYIIDPEISVESEGATTTHTIGVRELEAARPTARDMMHTEDGFSLRPYDYAIWADAPRDAVTEAIVDALREVGRFDVANAANMRAPELILTGTLRKFHEDRSQGQAVAVCEVRLDLRSRAADVEAEAVWSETLRAETPMAESTPVAMARAMSESVAEVAEQAAAGISAALD